MLINPTVDQTIEQIKSIEAEMRNDIQDEESYAAVVRPIRMLNACLAHHPNDINVQNAFANALNISRNFHDQTEEDVIDDSLQRFEEIIVIYSNNIEVQNQYVIYLCDLLGYYKNLGQTHEQKELFDKAKVITERYQAQVMIERLAVMEKYLESEY